MGKRHTSQEHQRPAPDADTHGVEPSDPTGIALGDNGESESLLETLDILSDPDTMAALAEAEEDIEAGRLTPLA